jgi:hypothetical protein
MLKIILGAVTGYIIMVVSLFITFTILYMILGPEGSFQPGSYHVSALWIIFSIIISFFAAYLGGYISTRIAKNIYAAYTLAGIVLIFGIVVAIVSIGGNTAPLVREGAVDNFEAMQNAVTPLLLQFLNPFIGAAGVLLGSRRYK